MSIASYFSRTVAPPLFRLMKIDIFHYRRWLLETEKWSPEKRDKWRLERLGDIIEHCWDHVPFYKMLWENYGVKIRRPRHFNELNHFPIVTRDMIRDNRDQLIPDNIEKIPHKADSTGGTTGSPLKYFHDLKLHALRYGYVLIGWEFAGYHFGDDVCYIAGGSLIAENRSLRNRARSWLERGHGVSCVGMNMDVALKCHQMILKFKPTVIHGYPSMIAEFCNIKDHFHPGPYDDLKAVITTAEMLHPHYRKQIEDNLCVPVFDHYGFNDGGLLSYECIQHSGYHYNDLESVVEVIDPDAHGTGRLAVTNLWNHSMPFIRYENGDLVTLNSEPCSCGRIYPLIGNVFGRSGDILRFANGNTLGTPGLTLIFKEMPIDGWQVVQKGLNNIEVRIKTNHEINPYDIAYIKKVIHLHASADVDVHVVRVEELSLTSRGKLKPVFVEMNQ